MSLFGEFSFFVLLAALLIPAAALGLAGKRLGGYGLGASVVVIAAALWRDPIQLCWLAGYVLLQLTLVQVYLRVRTKTGRRSAPYLCALTLSLLPVALAKLSEVTALHLFQFLGISYLTFRTAQVIIEIYDGVITGVKPTEFLAFLLFFPTVSSGPIDRSRRFGQDWSRALPGEEYRTLLGDGLQKLLLGMAYKFVCSAGLYRLLSVIDPHQSPAMLAAYAYAYGFYLFFDFAGYSLMAVGASYLLGVRTPDNFDKPFLSVDIKEFWNRWHITLSHWFRDFLFSRFLMRGIKGKWFPSKLTGAAAAFMVDMLVMGIWHGLKPCYLLYGLYHGALLAATEIFQKKSKFYKKHRQKRWYRVGSWLITLQLVMLGFLIFSGALV